uniref:Negative elongation factor B n=1 Tax=Meloidogyne hapla TaxID=6305 RepID=A0A1I8C1P2_MELHA
MEVNVSTTNSTPQYLSDLEKCGIATSNNLREILTTCSDPVEAIKQFQLANSIQLPSLKPVIKLLDLHGISRTDYHETVITELTERLVSKLRSFGNNQTPENVHRLERHLERCFRLYRVPRIRPIVLETLARLPKVADRYLKLIICDKELYDQCAVSVRQQIWVKNETLFLESIEPILDSYISEERRQHLITGEKGSEALNESSSDQHGQLHSPGINVTSCFFAGEVATKQRRQRKQDTLRERFLATENPYYCSLRFDLLMAVRDVNMEFSGKVDVCHDFAWCLDACSKHLRTKHLDAQQLNKLKTLLESGGGGKKCQNKTIIIPEMAMIAGDPHILHLIASFAVKMLRDNAGSPRPHLPKEMGSLQILLKLLVMGVHAKFLLMGEEQLINLVEGELKEVIGHFLPAFSTMLVQDAIRAELTISTSISLPSPTEELQSFEHRHPSIDKFIKEKYLCSLLWLHNLVLGGEYCPLSGTFKRRQIFEPLNAFRYCEPLLWMAKNLAIKDPWVQLLVQKLMIFPACLSNELTADLFIQQFFIPNLKRIPSAKFNLLRLTCHHRLTIPLKIFCKSLEELSNIFNKCEELEEELEEGEVNEEEEEEEGINDKILCQSFIKEYGKLKELMEETKISRGGGPPPLSSTSSVTTSISKESCTSSLEEKQQQQQLMEQ